MKFHAKKYFDPNFKLLQTYFRDGKYYINLKNGHIKIFYNYNTLFFFASTIQQFFPQFSTQVTGDINIPCIIAR